MKRTVTALIAAAVMTSSAQTTEDLTEYQGYLWGDSTFQGKQSQGINVQEAWDLGYRGKGVHIADVQMDWDLEHEDLNWKEFPKFSKTPQGIVIDGAKQHGTNTLGILFAEDDGKGYTGIATEAEGSVWDMLAEAIQIMPVGATIDSAAASLKAGDILQLELSTPLTQNHGAGPCELRRENWDAIKRAVDKGIVVLQAAGNGGENLDGSDYAQYRSWGDNGSIVVGAGSISQERLPISTYGERVNVQAWGDTLVATTGTYQWTGMESIEWHHGVTFGNDESRAYSFQYSGTSSALPIVTGVAAIFQSWAIDSLGTPLTSREMRDLLIASGNPQDMSSDQGHIGPIPDVSRGLELLREMLPTSISKRANRISSMELKGSMLSVQKETAIALYDIRGREMMRTTLTPDASFNLNSLNLAKGCYFLKAPAMQTLQFIQK